MSKQIIKIAEKLDWSVTVEDGYYYLQTYSPAGQDFHVEIEASSPEDFLSELKRRHEDFDPSYEASLWIGPDGHGTNGAPYDMRDLYDDMVDCKEMLLELVDALEKEI